MYIPRKMTLEEHARRDAEVAKITALTILMWAGLDVADAQTALTASADAVTIAVRVVVGLPPQAGDPCSQDPTHDVRRN